MLFLILFQSEEDKILKENLELCVERLKVSLQSNPATTLGIFLLEKDTNYKQVTIFHLARDDLETVEIVMG